jgi:probable aminopeptidase NPEPL1
VVRITFAKDSAAALKGARTVLVVGAQSLFDKKRFPRILSAQARQTLLDAASDVKPGDVGASATSLTLTSPRKVIAGVLPDRVSRYNSPAKPESVFKVVSGSGIAKEDRSAIVLLLEDESQVLAALNALGRAFPLYSAKSDEANGKETRIQVVALAPNGKPLRISAEVKETVSVAREAALLVDTPPSQMDPEKLAHSTKELLSSLPHVKVKEIVGDDLLRADLGGIHAVGRTALKAPRMLIATLSPPQASKTHVALVGKGITFDTGGLHLKSRGFMETMKSDMGGSAAVAGAFRVLAKTGSPHKLSLIMCIAENAIGPASYKPDDILTLHSGKTVEINNTDAEGRILLADGVSYAARMLKADLIIDAATLTGAQLIATGNMHAAVMSNDEGLERAAIEAGYASGDLVHPLPFAPEFYKAEFKSPIADMRNSVKDRANAQASCAGQFIFNHIEDCEVKWCHIDLAGPAFRNDRATGYGVALISELVRKVKLD